MPVRLGASAARLEMVTMRPLPARFMPGATACANRNAPVRLASTIWWKSSTGTSSSGFGRWPRMPPAT